ncbi:MAG: twin-arginine translocation signal domain-containing protein [Pirellulaceae bacterium]|jgi:hypothetical protein|nr:twin-arginine translocation signal domain-containing protein [Pirellulaceae bacterium]
MLPQRRDFLKWSAAAAVGAAGTPAAARMQRPRIAAIYTVLRFRSHAYNILENFLKPYLFRGKLVDPGVDVVSLYADQFVDEGDMSRLVSKKFSLPLHKSIDKALCRGGDDLAVDGVLLIGEHGDYPLNDLGQKMYPRKEFFDQIVAVMKRSRRYAPIFNDKHLSYRWDWAKEMYDETQRHGIPFLAGSSVPLAQRQPALELPPGAHIDNAVAVHGGGMETYDFHGLEVLQSFVEARRGGEAGIATVQFLTGDGLRETLAAEPWMHRLGRAAMQAELKNPNVRQGFPNRDEKTFRQPLKKLITHPEHALLITYRDGFRAAVLKFGDSSDRWNFACQLRGEKSPRSTALFNGPWGNRCLFKALSHSIQHLFAHRRAPYPVERTLLVSGVLHAAMRSRINGGESTRTPELNIPYRPVDFRRFREDGASWNVITNKTPQPVPFTPGDAQFLKQ